KTGSLRDAELSLCSAHGGEVLQELAIFLRCVFAVEALTQARDHGLRLDKKLALTHDLEVIHPYLKAPPNHINVRGGVPLGAGVLAVGVAEGDVHAGKLFVLKDVANYLLQFDVGADGKFADTVAVLVGVRVIPEVVLKL